MSWTQGIKPASLPSPNVTLVRAWGCISASPLCIPATFRLFSIRPLGSFRHNITSLLMTIFQLSPMCASNLSHLTGLSWLKRALDFPLTEVFPSPTGLGTSSLNHASMCLASPFLPLLQQSRTASCRRTRDRIFHRPWLALLPIIPRPHHPFRGILLICRSRRPWRTSLPTSLRSAFAFGLMTIIFCPPTRYRRPREILSLIPSINKRPRHRFTRERHPLRRLLPPRATRLRCWACQILSTRKPLAFAVPIVPPSQESLPPCLPSLVS